MPQNFLALNIENGITIVLMVLILYLGAALIFQIIGRGVGAIGGGNGASVSFTAGANLAT